MTYLDDLDNVPRLPFGRYRGKRLADVPAGYLRVLYVDGEEWLREPLRSDIRREIARRGVPFGAHKGVPLDELPDGYIQWLSRIDLFPPLAELVAEEVGRRARDEGRRRRRAEQPVPTKGKKPKAKKPKTERRER